MLVLTAPAISSVGCAQPSGDIATPGGKKAEPAPSAAAAGRPLGTSRHAHLTLGHAIVTDPTLPPFFPGGPQSRWRHGWEGGPHLALREFR
jgi:hypothetical protein